MENCVPVIIRFKNAPSYCGMNRKRFNREVRPLLTLIPIGKSGIGFYRQELDAWAEHLKNTQGIPPHRRTTWEKSDQLSGLRLRNGVWHIDKMVDGKRLYESTKVSSRAEAEKMLIHWLDEIREATVFGVRPPRTFKEAATRYLMENQHKRTISDEAQQIQQLCPRLATACSIKSICFPYNLILLCVNNKGVKNRTINHALQIIRHILNLAHQEWYDEFGLTWLASAAKIKLLPLTRSRPPYPLTWEEQDQLFALLPDYLRRMALFKVNTGLRDQEVCRLRWEWEYPIPELKTSVFVIPSEYSKNKCDRLVVLNEIAHKWL